MLRMYLKSLEVVGFKSFANPTVIHFHKGVTAVVGPNGCGKSNVLDSIRWALGEQSAKALRGGQMQDVIFNGTESRKRTGMAEVSLTFAECEGILDTEHHEMRLTRRVFRDGRSEYELNKKACRLRDIQKLFMDTGIGRSSYSIMEQGKIDQILSSKPDERRAIFEEAAGITKFKAQKKEALRKLELTEGNLLRVTDIIKEVRRQIGSLQRQAAKARKYQEVYGRLKFLDVEVAKHHYGTIDGQLRNAEVKVKGFASELSGLKESLGKRDEQLRQRRVDAENLDDGIRNLEIELGQARNGIERAQQAIQHHRERMGELGALKERNRSDITESEEKQKVQEEQVGLLEEDRKKALDGLGDLEQDVKGRNETLSKARAEVQDLERKRRQLEQSLARLDQQRSDGTARLGALELQQRGYVIRVEKLEEESKLLSERSQEVGKKLEVLKTQRDSKESELKGEDEKIEGMRRSVQEAEASFQEKRKQLDGVQRELSQLKARAEALEKMVKARTGFSKATRYLLGQFEGDVLAGALLDYVRVKPEYQGYERAVEICLGSAWEALLVKDSEGLKQVVEALGKGDDLGRAVIALPQVRNQRATNVCVKLIDKFRGAVGGLSDEENRVLRTRLGVKSEKRDPRSALSFVEVDEPVREWVEELLIGYFIACDSEEAEQLAVEMPYADIVSKEGQIWSRHGWQVRGGAEHAGHSVLEQDHELRVLREEISGVEKRLAQATEEMEDASKKVTEKERFFSDLQETRRQRQGELTALVYEVQGFERQVKELGQQREKLAKEQVQLGQQDERDHEQENELRKKIEEWGGQREQEAEQVDQVSVWLKDKNFAVEKMVEEVADARIRLSSKQQQAQVMEQQVASVKSRLEELREGLEKRRAEVRNCEEKVTESQQKIAEAEKVIEQGKEKIEKQEDALRGEREKRKVVQEECSQLEGHVRGDRERLGRIQSESGKVEVEVAEKKLRLEAIQDRILKGYGLDLAGGEGTVEKSEAGEDVARVSGEEDEPDAEHSEKEEGGEMEEIEDWGAAEEEVRQLQERISRMGPVNVEAITEYEELEERLTFLEKQEQDLRSSRDQLHEAIKKINLTTRELFSDTFDKIQKNFSEMFVELFGGGKATLSLVDADDPLESGIDIVAKPPGKQLQQISLLSGGERTMTAVSLLFAIYMVKPSPFCVLDEMDAPLDESNIRRFVNILQRFVRQSQFVVITHNKRTISSADVLYGVTMEEHGVSKIVSVKLSRQDEDPLFPRNDEDDVPTVADSVRGS